MLSDEQQLRFNLLGTVLQLEDKVYDVYQLINRAEKLEDYVSYGVKTAYKDKGCPDKCCAEPYEDECDVTDAWTPHPEETAPPLYTEEDIIKDNFTEKEIMNLVAPAVKLNGNTPQTHKSAIKYPVRFVKNVKDFDKIIEIESKSNTINYPTEASIVEYLTKYPNVKVPNKQLEELYGKLIKKQYIIDDIFDPKIQQLIKEEAELSDKLDQELNISQYEKLVDKQEERIQPEQLTEMEETILLKIHETPCIKTADLTEEQAKYLADGDFSKEFEKQLDQ